MVIESKHRQEVTLQEMVLELKTLITSMQHRDKEGRAKWMSGRACNIDVEENVSSHSMELVPWGRTTKLEFPHFNGEELEGWLLRLNTSSR